MRCWPVLAVLVFVRDQTLLIVTVHKDWLLQLPPLPLVAVVYATGMVLLFWRHTAAAGRMVPVLLMWCVIPVPSSFANKIDLPLQHASATVARAFAHLLGQQLTQDKLRLMFTPEFGMFIAPGCNGIRGAITLGLAAVIVSYLYRFRCSWLRRWWRERVLLGYLFNFLRLCLLVVYYKLALPCPWMQHHAKIADYVIGGCLFVCALVVFFAAAKPPASRRCGRASRAARGARSAAATRRPIPRARRRDAGAVGDLGVDVVRQAHARAAEVVVAPAPLPATIGNWTLVRSWTDTTVEGWIIYIWGEYAAPRPGGAHVSLGISPRLGVHDAEVCHIARGEDPKWHGQLTDATPSGETELTAAAYNNGVVQKLEASTVCSDGSCRQYSESAQHVTLVYARPEGRLPMGASKAGPVPVVLKVEFADTTVPVTTALPVMTAQLAAFLRQADLVAITAPYSKRSAQ